MKTLIAVATAVVGFLWAYEAKASVTVTAATGGTALSADSSGGAYTTLTGPKIAENNPGGIGTGAIILTAPSGFTFNTGASVTVAVVNSVSTGNNLALTSTTATVTVSNITINVVSNTTGSKLATLTFSGIQVRPLASKPLVSGTITRSGTATFVENPVTLNYGTLTEVHGAVVKLFTTLPGETFTSTAGNTGTVLSQTAGTAFNIAGLTATDQFTNIATSYIGSKTINYSGPGGNPTYTTSVIFANGVSTTSLATTLLRAETTTITATDGTVSGVVSSPLTILAMPANRLQILLTGETSNAGSITGKTGTPTATAAFSPLAATVNVTDTYGNRIAASDTIHFTSSDSLAILPANTSLTNGTGTFSVTLKARTTNTISVSDLSSGSISNGTSATITITNNPPVLTAVSNLTGAFEDTTFTISYATLRAQANVTDLDVNPVDALSFQVAAITSGTLTQNGSNAVAGSTFISSSSGALVWRGATNANGALNAFTVKAYDGFNFSATPVQVAVNVTAVNDVPSFTKGGNQTGLEDSGAQSIPNWATSISTGPSDESSQGIGFIVSNNNSNLFSVQPAVSSSGTLTYTPAANANGLATVTIAAQDTGGTLNSGADTSASQNFTISITAVNDAPSFVKGADITVLEDASAQSFSGWASSISAGPSNEASQTLTFIVSNNNSALFSVAPAISTNGTLTFTPAANQNGSSTVTVTLKDDGGTANSGNDTSAAQTFVINVTSVNDAPTLNAVSDLSILEDAGTQNVTLTGVSAGSNEASQTLSFSATSSNTNLISALSISYSNGATNASLQFIPIANANGTATITVTARDDGGTADSGIDTTTRSFTVSVTAVNDRPTLNTPSDVTVYEGSGVQTITLSGISAGPADESLQTVSLSANSSNTNLIRSPAISYSSGSSASLTFTPPTSGTGTATITVTALDNGGTANGGSNSVTRSFIVTVLAINHAPTMDTPTNLAMLEDAGVQNVTLTGISTGLSESGQTFVNFSASSSNTNLISSASISYTSGSTAVLSFTPLATANGTATITVTLQDDAGTSSGGIDTTIRTFDVTVTAVNDAPSFTKGTNIILRTTTATQAFVNWATSITSGPANESSQSLTVHISNDNSAMFSVQPTLSTNGTLTFAASGNGTATVSIYLQDNGGTANGGIDTSAVQTATITVYPINIAPSFSMSTNLTVLEDAGAQTVTSWATNISRGIADESGQALSFTVTNDNNSLFAVQPSLSTDGVLTFTPADDAYGSAIVTVILQDDGGTAYGGTDASTQSFTLTVTPVNDAPSFTKGLDFSLGTTSSRRQTITAWATGITAGPNESSQRLSFTVTNDTPEVFAQQPAISADGTLTFEIKSTAADVVSTVTVQLQDDGGTSNNGVDSSAAVFHIALSSSYGDATTYVAGQGPTGLFLGNLRGLTFPGATKAGGPRYRDMIVANSVDNTVSVRFCNDDGTFTDATTYPVGLGPFGVISGDFDRDGFEEIVTANFGTNTISVLENNKDRTFASAVDYITGTTANPGPISVMRDDFNGDGRLDLVVANYNENSVTVLLGLGNSTFGLGTNFSVGAGPMSVWTGDLNGDHKIDILTANKDDNTLTILPGLGNGSFGPAQTITLSGGNPQPVYAVTGDLNKDGRLDIVVANYGANTISVLLAQSNGTFTLSSNYAVGTNPRSVLVRDLDHDGNLDIAAANSGSSSVSILRNRGNGACDYAGNFLVGSSPLIVWGSNFDSDDATDLAISNYGDNTVSILRYNGPLAYNSQVSLLEDHPSAVKLNGRMLDSGTLTYTIVTPPAHGSLSGTAPNLIYTPETNYNGTDSLRFQVTYSVGDLIFDSAAAAVSLIIAPVNDAPSFNLSATTVALTNFNSLQTIPGFATRISAGPNEAAQQLTFTVTTTNTALFDIQPKLSSAGTLTFRPALNKSGTAFLSVRLSDNGGTSSGGTNASGTQTFTITVLPNPFMLLKGVYNGLFYESSGIANSSAGFFNLSLTDKRTFSGRLLLTGKAYSMSGVLNSDGIAQLSIPRIGQTALGVTVTLPVDGSANDQITGTVTDGTWTSTLLGDRTAFNALTNAAPKAGKYTMVFGGNPGSASNPAGDGLGTLTVKTDGTVTLAGLLADGTPFAQTVPISKTGTWPLYASLYGGKGLVMGWISFTDTADSSLEGNVSWVKNSIVGSKYYPLGFTNDLVSIGSTYVTPAVGTCILNVTNASVELSDGNLSKTLTNCITLATNNVVSVDSNTNGLAMTFLSSNGSLSGSFVFPKTKLKLVLRAVVLQKQDSAYGYFLGTNKSGLFELHQ